jgi:hypothetical protein
MFSPGVSCVVEAWVGPHRRRELAWGTLFSPQIVTYDPHLGDADDPLGAQSDEP